MKTLDALKTVSLVAKYTTRCDRCGEWIMPGQEIVNRGPRRNEHAFEDCADGLDMWGQDEP